MPELNLTSTPKDLTSRSGKRLDFQRLLYAWSREMDGDLAPATLETYRLRLRGFQAWCQARELPLLEVGPADVREWRNQLRAGYALSTVNQCLAAVNAFYAWLVEHEVLKDNPCRNIKRVSRRGGTRRHKRDELTDNEVLAVLATCDDSDIGLRDSAVLHLMAYCALRTIEAHRAWTSDVREHNGRMILAVRRKGHDALDDSDFVVLPPLAEEALRAWLAVHPRPGGPLFVSLSRRTRGGRLGLSYLRRMIKARYRRAGVTAKTKTAHSLRHSAISNLVRHGASILQVQSVTGHVDLASLLVYYHEHGRLDDPAEDRISYQDEKDNQTIHTF